MKILIVHPVMTFLGGGERLCCETIRALKALGHELTVLSESFDPTKVEAFFGFEGLFEGVKLSLYPRSVGPNALGTYSHLIHHIRGQRMAFRRMKDLSDSFDLLFSTQDAGYNPDTRIPVVQWGYMPKPFPHRFSGSVTGAVRNLPLRLHYESKVARIGLVLAISGYSKWHLDKDWRRPSVLVYPACNMVSSGVKRNLVVTAGRAAPEKRLDLFWSVARRCPDFEFVMLLTSNSYDREYSLKLVRECPKNGKIVFDPPKAAYDRVLGEAKVYLHLMQGEHFGITIVEAMSAGCVPIVHDSGGPRETVNDRTGFRWQTEKEIPGMVEAAIGNSPSTAAEERAQLFNRARFDERLASIFSGL